MILSNWCVVTQFYYRIIAVDTFLLFQLHFTTRVRKKYKLFTEFTKEKMFRGAFILAENYTKPFDGHQKHKFNIHMLYIKLEDDELDDEPDFPGYKGYADYYWVVVPYEQLDKGKRYIRNNPDIGLLCFTKLYIILIFYCQH